MSETTMLTPAQSKVVRNLHKAIRTFSGVNPAAPEEFEVARNEIVERFRELEEAFPKVAKLAAPTTEPALPELVEDMDAPEDALYSLLLECHAFDSAKTFYQFAVTLERMKVEISDLARFSYEYNANGGYWNVDWA